MTIIETIYRAAGSPPVAGAMDYEQWQAAPAKKKPSGPPVGKCYLSGIELHRVGVPVDAAIKNTFTGQSTAGSPDSEWVSPEAAYSIADKAKIPGIEKPSAMRQFTHVVVGDTWRVLGLSQKREMADILLNPPSEEWGMTICTKPMSAPHVLYRATTSLGGKHWGVILGDLTVCSSADEFRTLLADVEAQYVFHAKGAIETGKYSPKSVIEQGESAWMELEERIGRHRFSPLLDLTLFVAQKEKEVEDETEA